MDHDLATFNPIGEELNHGQTLKPQSLIYPATGSGVAEVRVIMSGFVIHGYLGMATCLVKASTLMLSVASGLTIGKEGPYVHIASAIANVVARQSPRHAVSTHREILGAGAASGIAVAFGAPISGVFFALEEVSYYFLSKALLPALAASTIAATGLRLFNGTEKTVVFQVRYSSEWHIMELGLFLLLGFLGGALGAAFIKTTRLWARHVRSRQFLRRSPLGEVALIAVLTGLATFWNQHTKQRPDRLLYELFSDCVDTEDSGFCSSSGFIRSDLPQLLLALIIKAILTTITFDLKIPAGIYIPSMILGALLGRIFGTAVQYPLSIVVSGANSMLGLDIANGGESGFRVVPGVYALLAAAATMCGVTRLTVTIVMIVLELSGSIDYIIPATATVLAAKWTADALEPRSIYDHLTEVNHYPFLSNKSRPTNLGGTLADITPSGQSRHYVDTTDSCLVKASDLCTRLASLRSLGEVDGGLPLLRNHVPVGFVTAPDLAYALDQMLGKDSDEDIRCLLVQDERYDVAVNMPNVVEFRQIDDSTPMSLDIHSSLDLVYECSTKLGVRHICVLKDGKYHGMVYKTAFIQHIQEKRKESSSK
ncbi:MAG: hypothetical protein Q9203_002626 [Teloschistes exilis]